jgi:TP901-1 family phage major tail protein
MTAQCGSAIVTSFKDSSGTYRAHSGLRTQSVAINAEAVDVTNSGSAGRWREILDGCGVRTMTISGEGPFVDDLAENAALDAIMNNQVREGKILIPGLGTFEGHWKVTQLELSGEYNEGVMYSQTLESAGEITFTGV